MHARSRSSRELRVLAAPIQVRGLASKQGAGHVGCTDPCVGTQHLARRRGSTPGRGCVDDFRPRSVDGWICVRHQEGYKLRNECSGIYRPRLRPTID